MTKAGISMVTGKLKIELPFWITDILGGRKIYSVAIILFSSAILKKIALFKWNGMSIRDRPLKNQYSVSKGPVISPLMHI